MADTITPATKPMPALGTPCVHKDDHAKGSGPVWEVKKIMPSEEKPIHLGHARHKLNNGLDPQTKKITQQEFESDYRQL